MFGEVTLFDHLYVVLFAVVHPLVGYVAYQKLLKLAAAGYAPQRTQLYQQTMTGHWVLMLLGVVLWLSRGHSWAAMGFSWNVDGYWLIGTGIALIVIALLVAQNRRILTASAQDIADLQDQFRPLMALLPQTRAELHGFYRLSVTAGIVEEILWRGVLLWYLGHFMPVWLAAVIGVAGFGLAHSYQGWSQVPKVMAIGTVFTVVFLLTGSVWVPIVLHAAVDILQGKLSHDVLNHAAADPLN